MKKIASLLFFFLVTLGFSQKKPNIVVIMSDDVGYSTVSAYGLGINGYQTKNIDRIAKEGMLFTDHYSQPSCTAGRAAFITGQMPIRTGLTTVGFPGDKLGLQKQTPTLAEVLKNQGYRTGQFGKNHLGDRNDHLPTVHGFDEFYGNLYHLNTENEYENPDYPKDPEFTKKYGTRGVLHCYATAENDATVDPRFGEVGKQKITDTGKLSTERMKTIDEDFAKESIRFMKESKDANKPFFVWFAPTRMHVYTHVPDKYIDSIASKSTGYDLYGAGMIQHDETVGDILKALDKMGLAENTIVIYTSDNGPEANMTPDGGTTPFRGEKMTTYEGGFRVPFLVKWPKHISAGTISNEIQSHEDIFTSLAIAAGEPDDFKEKLKTDRKVFIDGVNNLPLWTGKATKSNRDFIFYYYESSLKAMRVDSWKAHFGIKENYWGAYEQQTFPILVNLRKDPYERNMDYQSYGHLAMQHNFLFMKFKERLSQYLGSLMQFPPVQRANTIDISVAAEQVLNNVMKAAGK